MGTPRLAVVVLTWEGRDDTLACLASLHAAIGPEDVVIVVDNGSSDGTVEAVRAAHPWAQTIENGRNLGFAGGNNVGLRRALDLGARWVLLLNNDTKMAPDTLGTLLAHAEASPRAGAFQPLLVSAEDPFRVDSAGHRLFLGPGVSDDLMGRPVAQVPRGPVPIFGACGAAALLRADALRAAGLLDEGFFVLAEDVDLMFRIRLAGWDVHLVPAARVLHSRGISVPGRRRIARLRRYWLQRNLLAIALRYWPAREILKHAPMLSLRALVVVALRLTIRGHPLLPVWAAALRARRASREGMVRLGLDAWLGRSLADVAQSGP